MASTFMGVATTCMYAISQITAETNKELANKLSIMNITKRTKEAIARQVEYYENLINRQYKQQNSNQDGPYSIFRLSRIDNPGEVFIPWRPLNEDCETQGSSKLFKTGLETASTWIGQPGNNIKDDFFTWANSSGRLEALKLIQTNPREIMNVPNPNDPVAQAMSQNQIGSPRLAMPGTAPDADGRVTSPAERFDPNWALAYALDMARTGNSNLFPNGTVPPTFPQRRPDEHPQDYGRRLLVENKDVVKLFVESVHQYSQGWNIQGAPDRNVNPKAYDDFVTTQIQMALQNPDPVKQQEFALAQEVPVFTNSGFTHLQTIAQARGQVDPGRDIPLVQRHTLNGADRLENQDSTVQQIRLDDAKEELVQIDEKSLAKQNASDTKTTLLKQLLGFWERQLAEALAQMPKAIARSFGGSQQNTA